MIFPAFPIETSISLGISQPNVFFWAIVALVRSEVNKATPPLKVPVLALASGENTKPEAPCAPWVELIRLGNSWLGSCHRCCRTRMDQGTFTGFL